MISVVFNWKPFVVCCVVDQVSKGAHCHRLEPSAWQAQAEGWVMNIRFNYWKLLNDAVLALEYCFRNIEWLVSDYCVCAGDLLYLYVETLEDKKYHITSSTRGFYINQ